MEYNTFKPLEIVRVSNCRDVDRAIKQVGSKNVKLYVSPDVLRMIHCRCTYIYERMVGYKVTYNNADVIVNGHLKHMQIVAIEV